MNPQPHGIQRELSVAPTTLLNPRTSQYLSLPDETASSAIQRRPSKPEAYCRLIFCRFWRDVRVRMKRFLNNLRFKVAGAMFVLAWTSFICSCRNNQHAELNLLCWTGYEEPSMIEPFEKKFNVKVNYKTFAGADQMFALVTQSKAYL